MKQPRGCIEYGKEGCCPEDWDHTPNMTGDYIMDGSIKRCKNRDMAAKISDHLVTDVAYMRNTAYNRSSVG